MKYPLLSNLLALATIDLQSNFFGNKKPSARFDEDQLQAIEDALAKSDTAKIQNRVTELEEEQNTNQQALNDAFNLAGLKAEEMGSFAEAIAALGARCDELGKSTNRHSFAAHDGKEKKEGDGLIDGYVDPNAAHNQMFAKFNKK